MAFDANGQPVPEPAAPPVGADGGAPQPPPVAPGAEPPVGGPPAAEPPADTTLADATLAMGSANADDFLNDFLAGNGIDLADGAPVPPVVPPVGGQPAAAPGNAPPGAPTGTSPPPVGQQPPPVDPNQLQRLFNPQLPPPGQPPAPVVAPWTQQQQPPPAPVAQAPQGQPAPDAPYVPFDQAVQLPPQLAAGLDHEDPNVRHAAMGAIIASAGNMIVQRTLERITQHVLPQFQRDTMGAVQQQTFQERVAGDLYGKHPHLRMASPALLQQAATVVIQDEMRANPNAAYTPEIMDKIGRLATAGMQQMAAGYSPQLTAPPAPQQPPPVYYPPQGGQPPYQPAPAAPPQGYPPVTPQGYVWNGIAYVPAAPGQYMPPQQPYAPAPQPYMAGPSAGQMGFQGAPVPTPDSEFASFMNGDWG